MNNSGTPNGENGKNKDVKELKITYIDDSFDEKFDCEICCFGFDYESDIEIKKSGDSTVAYFHDQKSDEYFGLDTPEKQAEIREEAIKLGKVKMVVDKSEKGVKQLDKEEMENAKEIKEKKAKIEAVKKKADQIRKADAERKLRENKNSAGGTEKPTERDR